MNSSTFMDKQIMDLSQQRNEDFINLMNHPRDEEDHVSGNGITKEEMVPSYDFQPIRPIVVSSSSKTDASPNPSGDWHFADSSRDNYVTAPVRRYASLESTEPAKVTPENDQVVIGSKFIAEIDRTMKKHVDNLVCILEGVSARLTQLESRTRHLESSVDDLTVSVGNNHGSVDGKMRQLENIVREVQSGVQDVKDKQGIMESKLQIEIAKLQVSKVNQQSESRKAAHTDSVQQAISLPVIPPQPVGSLPPPNAPPQPPQQNLPPSVQLLNQFPQNPIPSGPPRDPYFPPSGQTPEVANPQYQVSQSQQPQPPPSASPHQPYQPAPRPQYPNQPPQLPSTQISHQHPPSVNSPQYQSQHAEEVPYIPPQNYPPTLHQPPPSQPPTGPSPAQQFYGAPNLLYEPPSGRSSSGFSSGYSGPPGPNEPYQYGGAHSSYGSGTSALKSQQFPSISPPQSGGGGYQQQQQQLPTARILPPALPTASEVGSGAGSSGSGNRVPVDDVVDKVTHMGFPRDVVRATVRKLTENGQSVDLNVVLDRLMNDGEGQPPRGWFGR